MIVFNNLKYYLDCEFIEGFHKPLFGKNRHFIDLISIGIVCEDGRTYSAISKEYSYKDASEWVKQNVIEPLYRKTVDGYIVNPSSESEFHKLFGQSNDEIKNDILDFFGCWRDQHFWRAPEGIEVFGYFADYDWVLLCSLFGRMIDLPNEFPMYCIDLKQIMDRKANQLRGTVEFRSWRAKHQEANNLKNAVRFLKEHRQYPKQTNEHDALADANWNQQLHNFLLNL